MEAPVVILNSVARIVIGFSVLFIGFAVWSLILIALLPWRVARIKACNVFGSTVGRAVYFCSGCSLNVKGRELVDFSKPAIYISNHTSVLDIFIGIWQSPMGTVGIAKESIIYYPLFGQIYHLSGHLRIDRSNPRAAIKSMKSLAGYVNKHGLSIFMWPEGTRARDGRLMPFKKGIGHLALKTGLPIVPMVVKGAHKAWEKNTLALRKVNIEVEFLPAVDTSDWRSANLAEKLAEVNESFVKVLPPDQHPGIVPAPEADASPELVRVVENVAAEVVEASISKKDAA
jgi:1-acyl-sn-glycerol-3-phosphate acyltransferase